MDREHEVALRSKVRKVGFLWCSVDEMEGMLGYKPPVVQLSPDEAQDLPDSELLALIPEDMPFVQRSGGLSRSVVSPQGHCTLLIEECVQWCDDCHALWPVLYMVHDDLWKAHAPDEDAILCLDCFSQRAGRKMTSADLNDAPINRFPDVRALMAAHGRV
tara:strand:+ start:824 stop:1303 length:480 start_codon:yes stop_codon:yes gene_type:complete